MGTVLADYSIKPKVTRVKQTAAAATTTTATATIITTKTQENLPTVGRLLFFLF